MAINKVIYGGNTLIDLTGDSVTKDKLLAGYTAHDKSGEVIEGTCLFDVDSTDATATAAEILNGQTAYARGNKVSGTMKNNGAVSEEITDKDSVYTIQSVITTAQARYSLMQLKGLSSYPAILRRVSMFWE